MGHRDRVEVGSDEADVARGALCVYPVRAAEPNVDIDNINVYAVIMMVGA